METTTTKKVTKIFSFLHCKLNLDASFELSVVGRIKRTTIGPLNWFRKVQIQIYRGYYTVARRYEFYVQVARPISHE